MKKVMKVLVKYLDHSWIQIVGVILPCLGYTALVVERIRLGSSVTPAEITRLADFVQIMFLLLFVALLGILAAIVRHLVAKRWARAKAGFKLFLLAFLGTFFVFVVLMPPMMFRIEMDDENDDETITMPSSTFSGLEIVVPPDMKTTVPLAHNVPPNGVKALDPEGQKLLAALSEATPLVDTAIPMSLNAFSGDKSTLLLRDLATSAMWRVWKFHDKLVATRRFIGNAGQWDDGWHGFSSRRELIDKLV